MNYGFQLWLRKLQAKGTSPALIRNQFETFLVLIGQQHEDLDLSRLSAGISFCLSYFGEIYIRWSVDKLSISLALLASYRQPNKDCDDPDEVCIMGRSFSSVTYTCIPQAVFRTANLVYTDYLPMSTSEPPVPLGDSSLKRKVSRPFPTGERIPGHI